MPPKPKCTKEDIIKTAFEMTRENGIESVVARELGKRLGVSVTPIFSNFKSMHELEEEVRKLAMQEFDKYIADALNYSPAFKQFGMQMIRFAKEEPKLFQVLYMQEHAESLCFDEMFKKMGEVVKVCVEVVQKDYDLTEKEAYEVFSQSWLTTFSLCVLEANKICSFSDDEISEVLSRGFQAILMLVKSGGCKVVSVDRESEMQSMG